MAFIFPSMKMHNSWLKITKSCHSTLKNYYRRHERKVQQSLFVSVEINSTIAKLTVWHNWLNSRECVWLEAAKLACTSPPAMELLHVHTVFWCLLAWNHSQTFVDLLPLAEKTENVVFLCCFSHFSPPNTPF